MEIILICKRKKILNYSKSNHGHGQCANFGLVRAVFLGFGKLGT